MNQLTKINLNNHVSVDTEVTATASGVDAMIEYFLASSVRVIGFDTEWAYLEEGEGEGEEWKAESEVAILQLCDRDKCLIVQLMQIDSIPRSLFNFLRLPDFTFVGVGIQENLSKLRKEYGFGCKNAVELGPLAAKVMEKPQVCCWGIDKLAEEIASLKFQRPRRVVFDDWGALHLNKRQIKVATINAYASYAVGVGLLCRQNSV